MDIVDEIRNEVNTEVHLDEPTQVYSYIMRLKYDLMATEKRYLDFADSVVSIIKFNESMMKFYGDKATEYEAKAEEVFNAWEHCSNGNKDFMHDDYIRIKNLAREYSAMHEVTKLISENADLFNVTSNSSYLKALEIRERMEANKNDDSNV